MTTPKIFDISKCKAYVDGIELVEIGSGIGITPKRETKVIDSLYGPVGFNMDPNTGAEVTISLLSTSASNDKMRSISNSQKVVSVSVKSADKAATGFEEISVDYVIFQHADKKLEGDAPTYEYKGVGYGFGEK